MKADEIRSELVLTHGKVKDEVEELNYNELRTLLKEIKATAKEAEEADETVNADATTQEPEKVEETAPFVAFCGESFDCKANSECFTICKADNPEEFAKCEAHFKATAVPAEKAKSGKPKRGKNVYGHLIGSQAGLIDDALTLAEGPVTIEEIAEFAGAKKPRTRHHIKHLQNDWKVIVKITPEKKLFLGTLTRFKELSVTEGIVDFV